MAITQTITLLPPPVFSHDQNGNMTGDGEWVNVFNDADRLVSQIRENDTKIEFVYDGIGRRRIKKTYNWSGTDWILDREYRFTYEQWLMIGESVLDAQGTVVDEKIYTWGVDLSGTVGGAGLARRRLGEGGGVGGLLAVKDNSGTYYPYFDANGNVIAYTDINGVPVAEYEYSPFGEIVKKSGSKANDFNFRFSTQYYDSETELYSFIFRYYSPRYTRWLNRDPICIEGGINEYAYCFNNPINNWDYLGLLKLSKEDCEVLPDVIKDAYLAQAAYSGKATEGYRLVKTYEDEKSGFKAHEFISDDGTDRVVAFAGTENWPDIQADAQQFIGMAYTKQYEFASQMGNEYKNTARYVGHSLGGGLAHTAAISQEHIALTFNAAGIHDNIKQLYEHKPGCGEVVNIHTKSDALTAFQKGKFVDTGRNIAIPNPRDKGLFESKKLFKARMHSIQSIINALEKLYREECECYTNSK